MAREIKSPGWVFFWAMVLGFWALLALYIFAGCTTPPEPVRPGTPLIVTNLTIPEMQFSYNP